MVELLRWALRALAVLLGAALAEQTDLVLVVLTVAVVVAAAVVVLGRIAPAVSTGPPGLLVTRARRAADVPCPWRSAPSVRRRHRSRAPGLAG